MLEVVAGVLVFCATFCGLELVRRHEQRAAERPERLRAAEIARYRTPSPLAPAGPAAEPTETSG